MKKRRSGSQRFTICYDGIIEKTWVGAYKGKGTS